MPVIDIDPDSRIISLGRIGGTFHVYNTGQPGGGDTTVAVTIVNVGAWTNIVLRPGHVWSGDARNNPVFIQDSGPSRVQVLTDDAAEAFLARPDPAPLEARHNEG